MARPKLVATAGQIAGGESAADSTVSPQPPFVTTSQPSSRPLPTSFRSPTTTIPSSLSSPTQWSRSAILARRRQMFRTQTTATPTTSILADAIATLTNPTLIAAATLAYHPPLRPRMTTAISPVATAAGPSATFTYPTLTLNVDPLHRLQELTRLRAITISPVHSTIVSTHRALLPPPTTTPVTRDFVSSLGASTTITSSLTLDKVQRLLAASGGGHQWAEPPPTLTSPMFTTPEPTPTPVYTVTKEDPPSHPLSPLPPPNPNP